MMKISIYPKIETGYAFTEDMNDKLVEEFNNQTFNKSAILKIKYYNPPDIILQHLPVKEEVIAKFKCGPTRTLALPKNRSK